MRKYINLFNNAPVAMAVFEARSLKLDLVNPAMLQLLKREKNILGTRLLEFMPEVAEQPYPEILNNVIRTGKPYKETGAKVYLRANDKLETIFIDYSLTPIFDKNNKVKAVFVVSVDVGEREMSKLGIEESERNLRALVMSAPVAMAVFKGDGLIVQIVNDRMLNLWNDNKQLGIRELQHVFHNGVSYAVENDGICFSYTPLRDAAGKISGVVVVGNKKD